MTEIAIPEPAPSRRGVMFYGSAFIAASVLAGSTTAAIADPIIDLISKYYSGLSDYTNRYNDDMTREQVNVLCAETFEPWYDRLSEPLPAITTTEGAKAALTLIREESSNWADSPVISNLADALLAWVGADA